MCLHLRIRRVCCLDLPGITEGLGRYVYRATKRDWGDESPETPAKGYVSRIHAQRRVSVRPLLRRLAQTEHLKAFQHSVPCLNGQHVEEAVCARARPCAIWCGPGFLQPLQHPNEDLGLATIGGVYLKPGSFILCLESWSHHRAVWSWWEGPKP